MRKSRIVAVLLALALLPARAAAPLAAGKPAGVHAAQAGTVIGIYGGVLLYAALLYALIGTSGDPATSATST